MRQCCLEGLVSSDLELGVAERPADALLLEVEVHLPLVHVVAGVAAAVAALPLAQPRAEKLDGVVRVEPVAASDEPVDLTLDVAW